MIEEGEGERAREVRKENSPQSNRNDPVLQKLTIRHGGYYPRDFTTLEISFSLAKH